MKTVTKIIINVVLFLLFLFFAIACIVSFSIEKEGHPKSDNIMAFGALSLLFLLIFVFWDKRGKSWD